MPRMPRPITIALVLIWVLLAIAIANEGPDPNRVRPTGVSWVWYALVLVTLILTVPGRLRSAQDRPAPSAAVLFASVTYLLVVGVGCIGLAVAGFALGEGSGGLLHVLAPYALFAGVLALLWCALISFINRRP